MANVFQNFNPYKEAKFKQSYTGDNQEFILTKDGVPMAVTDSDGVARLLMGPAIFLKRKTLIEWFKSVYPDGSIDEELVTYESSKVILKVSLYKNFQRSDYLASAHGIALEKNHFYDVFRDLSTEGTENSADLYNLAFYLGLKMAMERAGFLLNYDPEFLMENVPGYKEACHTGQKAEDSAVSLSQEFSSKVAGPTEETLTQEKKLTELEKEVAEATETALTKEPTLSTDPALASELQKVKEPEPEDDFDLPDPIQAFYADNDAKVSGCKASDEPKEEMECNPVEMVPESSDLGNTVFHVSELASMKLKAYDGELLKNLPRDFLEYVASKEWNGKIEKEMLEAIKEYLF